MNRTESRRSFWKPGRSCTRPGAGLPRRPCARLARRTWITTVLQTRDCALVSCDAGGCVAHGQTERAVCIASPREAESRAWIGRFRPATAKIRWPSLWMTPNGARGTKRHAAHELRSARATNVYSMLPHGSFSGLPFPGLLVPPLGLMTSRTLFLERANGALLCGSGCRYFSGVGCGGTGTVRSRAASHVFSRDSP